jgi:hypothetical protein
VSRPFVLLRLAWIALALGAAHVIVALGMSWSANPEGWVGSLLYALMYALPLLLVALALRSSRWFWRTLAGWVALLLATYYVLLIVVNWSGYSNSQATFALAVTLPTVALDLVIFWAAGLHRGGPAAAA